MEFAQVLNGIRWRHEVPGVEGAPALIVINTVLQMPNLETAKSYLDRWPGLFQEVLDLQGIVGEVVDPAVLLGDEGYHSAYAFTLDTGDGTVVDGLNLAGLFQGPTSTWFASVSLRSSAPRPFDPEVSTLVEEYQAKLGGIAGSGFISAYDSILRWTLNTGTEYLPVLLPTVPMPDISALLPQVDESPREPCLDANSCPDAAPCCSEVCCRTGEACIDSECCPAAAVCGAFCCPPDETCGGGSCCPPTALCGGVCCEFESVCAADRCCLLDDLCVSSDGASRTCCTEEDGTCVDGACVAGTTG